MRQGDICGQLRVVPLIHLERAFSRTVVVVRSQWKWKSRRKLKKQHSTNNLGKVVKMPTVNILWSTPRCLSLRRQWQQGLSTSCRRLYAQRSRFLPLRLPIVPSNSPQNVPHRFGNDPITPGTTLVLLAMLTGQEFASPCRHLDANDHVLPLVDKKVVSTKIVEMWCKNSSLTNWPRVGVS